MVPAWALQGVARLLKSARTAAPAPVHKAPAVVSAHTATVSACASTVRVVTRPVPFVRNPRSTTDAAECVALAPAAAAIIPVAARPERTAAEALAAALVKNAVAASIAVSPTKSATGAKRVGSMALRERARLPLRVPFRHIARESCSLAPTSESRINDFAGRDFRPGDARRNELLVAASSCKLAWRPGRRIGNRSVRYTLLVTFGLWSV